MSNVVEMTNALQVLAETPNVRPSVRIAARAALTEARRVEAARVLLSGLRARLGRGVTDAELASLLHVSEAEAVRVRKIAEGR